MIVITGASGKLGGMVAERVVERAGPERVGLSVRDPEPVRELEERGVRVRRGDYDDPESLLDAFAGAERLLLVSAPRTGQALLQAHRTAIDAAKRAGVGRIFYTSHVGSDPISPFPPMVGHAATEGMLRDSGVPFTVLRNGFYTATPEMQFQQALRTGELRLPPDAPVSWTTHEDLADGIAALLVDDEWSQPALNLTASEALDLEDLAVLGTELAGRPIRRVVVPDEEYRAGLITNGTPELGAAMAVGLWAASRQRRFGIVDPTLGQLLRRPTRSLRGVLQGIVSR